MLKAGAVFLAVAVLASISACDTGQNTPSEPSSGSSTGYDGQWTGTTYQGRSITFVVSSDQKVTAITVGYDFNGCSGVKTFSSLSLDIGVPPNRSAPTLGPTFGYGSGPPDGSNYTQVYGSFTSSTTATGSVIFGSYAGCGTSGGIWSASKR